MLVSTVGRENVGQQAFANSECQRVSTMLQPFVLYDDAPDKQTHLRLFHDDFLA